MTAEVSAGFTQRQKEPGAPAHAGDSRGHLRLSLRNVSQLFNSLDPSPFYEKDLDADAEAFLVSWAEELHSHADLRLTLYLREAPAEPQPERWIGLAIHHYFAERARLQRASLKALMRQGRMSLGVGITFLAICLLLARWIAAGVAGTGAHVVVSESLTIAGWVAMWRPLQIYLYDWWPLLRRQRLYEAMARMPVELRLAESS